MSNECLIKAEKWSIVQLLFSPCYFKKISRRRFDQSLYMIYMNYMIFHGHVSGRNETNNFTVTSNSRN